MARALIDSKSELDIGTSTPTPSETRRVCLKPVLISHLNDCVTVTRRKHTLVGILTQSVLESRRRYIVFFTTFFIIQSSHKSQCH